MLLYVWQQYTSIHFNFHLLGFTQLFNLMVHLFPGSSEVNPMVSTNAGWGDGEQSEMGETGCRETQQTCHFGNWGLMKQLEIERKNLELWGLAV